MPFALPADAPTYHDTYEAKYVTRYLERYVDTHTYEGRSLRDRIRFRWEVRSIEHDHHGAWAVTGHGPSGPLAPVRAQHLVVASGLTSQPNMPELRDLERFANPVYHHRDFAMVAPKVLGPIHHAGKVTVLGGGKSAADMVYVSVKAGESVHWIIPRTGSGPAAYMDPRADPPYRNAVEAGMTRQATAMNPSCFASLPEWARVLHRSPAGASIVRDRALATDRRYREFADYTDRPGALAGFRNLETNCS